jgi:serine/threonine protein phosphatase PrpC
MEDRFVAVPSLRAAAVVPLSPPCRGGDTALFAVFDGHGGARTASALAQRLPGALAPPLLEGDVPLAACVPALAGACLALDDELLAGEGAHVSGSTACVLLLRPGRELACVNVGDSRGVLCAEGGAAEALSRDHTCAREDERARVRAAGGTLVQGRLGGVLAVTRAFGDADHKRGKGRDRAGGALAADPCTSLPDVECRTLRPEDEFVLLATDGLWGAMGSSAAVRFARRRLLDGGGDAAPAAGEVADKALELGASDNVTVLLVLLGGGDKNKCL